MNYKKNLENVLNGKEVDITPVITVTQSGILDAMKLTGTSWPTAHEDPEQMATLGASLHELAGLEDAKIPFCLAVEAESMGCEVDLGSGGRTPEVVKSPFDDPREIEIPDNFETSGRIPVICEAVEILHERYDNLPVCVGITGPFTVAGHMIGVEEILKMINLDYWGVDEAVEVATEAVMAYIKELNEVKPDVICVADPTSSGDLLSPLDFQQISRPPLEDIEKAMKSQNVLHICGHTGNMLKDMLSCGYNGISIEEAVDMRYAQEVKASLGDKCQVCGNISTSRTLFRGTPEEVRTEVLQALEKGVDVVAPSCGIAASSPLVNIQAMVNARNEFFGIE
ncbi:MAG TPA: MtaA/CmuA family methyltransferase [Methanosphaera sp.]|nr:MtaA/CmuA family methyltransferase [Methanosphaera sp.]HIJ15118.1 MtaA/CmuA family methyltransferase [Methanosphaera sp.]